MFFHEVVDLRNGAEREQLEVDVDDLIGRVVEELKELVGREERLVEPERVAGALAQLFALGCGQERKCDAERAPFRHHLGEQLEAGFHVARLVVAAYLPSF